MFSYIFNQIWLNQVMDDSHSNYITKINNIKFIIIIIIIELFLGR